MGDFNCELQAKLTQRNIYFKKRPSTELGQVQQGGSKRRRATLRSFTMQNMRALACKQGRM